MLPVCTLVPSPISANLFSRAMFPGDPTTEIDVEKAV